MSSSIALPLLLVSSARLGVGAFRLSVSQSVTASSRASSSAWHTRSFKSPGVCSYKKLLEAKVRYYLQPAYYLAPLTSGTNLVRGTHIVTNQDFESDFPPGQTSEVSADLEGIVMEQFPRRHQFPEGLVVKFPRGHAGFYPTSFGKLSTKVPYKPIEVIYCGGKRETLRKGEPDYNAFADVQWEDESLVGQDISDIESSHIQNYAGSYAYASNVAKSVLNGLLPTPPDRNSGRASWSSETLTSLTTEVLQYDVNFATALNKLPYPLSQVSLFRGSWETPETLEHLKLSHKQQSSIAQSRFMSTTLAADHACNFLSSRNEPPECRSGTGASGSEASGCVNAQKRFPVLYEIQTTRAKNIQKWNEKEQEFMMLPNHALDVVEVEQVQNDRIYPMTPEELAAEIRPSFPEVADAVLEAGLDGSAFVAAVEKSPYRFVDTLLGYDMRGKMSWEVGWPLENHYALKHLLGKDRFTLKCASMDVKGEIIDNTVPYYYRIVMRDSAE
mmetsp:Transcript_36875/g.59128  ORF Transcript_36875/g.59128 Transcript_36875/m.59128 type:complete len:500 (+) Transcript_36875:56-1555(+)